MINLSLLSGSFPQELKCVVITPLLKNPRLQAIYKNYRPINNLPYVSKLLERAVVNHLTSYQDENNLLPVCQSFYRKYHSTETALAKIQYDILNMDQKKLTLFVIIDLSAAFDTVDHPILLNRLEYMFGVTGSALK